VVVSGPKKKKGNHVENTTRGDHNDGHLRLDHLS